MYIIQHIICKHFGVNVFYCEIGHATTVHLKNKAVNLLARLHGNVCLVLTKSKVLNDKKMNGKVENMNLVGIAFLEFTIRF